MRVYDSDTGSTHVSGVNSVPGLIVRSMALRGANPALSCRIILPQRSPAVLITREKKDLRRKRRPSRSELPEGTGTRPFCEPVSFVLLLAEWGEFHLMTRIGCISALISLTISPARGVIRVAATRPCRFSSSITAYDHACRWQEDIGRLQWNHQKEL